MFGFMQIKVDAKRMISTKGDWYFSESPLVELGGIEPPSIRR